jgi:hypothetical protein
MLKNICSSTPVDMSLKHGDVSPFPDAKSIVIYGWDGMLRVQLQQNGDCCTEGMDSLIFIM